MCTVFPVRFLVANPFVMSFSVILNAAEGEIASLFASCVSVQGRCLKAIISVLEIIC